MRIHGLEDEIKVRVTVIVKVIGQSGIQRRRKGLG
jgi:hypothetical protein